MKLRIILTFCQILLLVGGCSYVADAKPDNITDEDKPVIINQPFEEDITIPGEVISDDDNIEELDNNIESLDDEKILLFDSFLSGDTQAFNSEGLEKWVTDYEFDDTDWNCYRIGEQKDVDNDDMAEQIIEGPKGGFYLDIISDKVYICRTGTLDFGEMTYIVINDECWILYSDAAHSGREAYDFVKMHGDAIEDEIYLVKYEEVNAEGLTEEHCYINNEEVTKEEYKEKKSALLVN